MTGLRRIRLVLPAIASAAALLAAAPGATAAPVPCDTALVDAGGASWAQPAGLMILGGTAPPLPAVPTTGVGATGTISAPPTGVTTLPTTCESELDDRQIAVPAQPVGATGLTLERKVYVPSDAPAFVRVVDTWNNTTAALRSPQVIFGTNISPATHWRSTSSGDALVTPLDDWVVLANNASGAPTAPVLGEIWSNPPAPQRADTFFGGGPTFPPPAWTSGGPNHLVSFPAVTLQPGESRKFMHVYFLRPGTTAGLTAAEQDAAAIVSSDRVFEGLRTNDVDQIVNWGALDPDGDGLSGVADNCRTVANPDQVDSDADGQGDACDADDDNDGLPDSIEDALGSNARGADTDGDGKADGQDACLKLAAATADGCPAPAGPQQQPRAEEPRGEAPRDTTAPVVAITGVKKTLKLKSFLKGVTATITCDEPCSVEADLLGSAKSVRLAASYNLTLGSKSLGLGGGARKITMKPSKRLVGKAKKLSAQLRITATDASGNRTRKTLAFKVK